MIHLKHKNKDYRHNVGICLFNQKGLVLVAERRDFRGSWQMPQGGVKAGEEPEDAVFREMNEEIGTDNGRIISKIPGYLCYDFLEPTQYKGQQQEWFALLFLGKDTEINVLKEHKGKESEFVNWRWVPLQETVDLIIPFKREVYMVVRDSFTPIGEALSRGEKVYEELL
ncbi:MAG TPA: RNA pyrophosphohydrolase [Methanospirillum sp.]|uniref:RNA pyrophosphohydrolase n=1 Tax=Methanospirillum sp. TaxID=45200 RepID=UPI002C79B9EF|nr:RNA pyrophosphohydrolase [Methanospirillum sp.]HWQ63898.1 RNA pyrophosphohydrolase [Methanospirillum sp.]